MDRLSISKLQPPACWQKGELVSTKKDALPLIGQVVLLSMDPRVGFHGGKVPLTTKDGRTLCCLAQRGECRYNSRHYESCMRSERAWTLPQIEPRCDRRCGYRAEVAKPQIDTEYTTRLREDLYGFEFYKRPSDACTYYPAEGEYYRHDPKTCPQCSQQQVEPSDDWVDVVMVDLYAERDHMMRGMFKMRDDKEYDPIEELPFTPGTKAAIRAKMAQQGNSDDEE